MNLRIALKDWTDWDFAAYRIAICLSLMPEGIMPGRGKHVFWSANPMGDALHDFLLQLAKAGVLERREDPDEQFRWNPQFRGSWE